MKVYNTLVRRKEEFVPREPGKVSMYVCGVTPYDSLHIGHARTFVIYDMIRRHLERSGYVVEHVQNVTDIDDKIIQRAAELNEDPLHLSHRLSEDGLRDCDALGLQRAHHYPRVSEHIGDIIAMIETLIAKEKAYESAGSVYFDVSEFEHYGCLSGRDREDLLNGARIEPGEDKRDPGDFALWKRAKDGEPAWESPWGPGRPGWHIECSAMSLHYFGSGFDVHGGAVELVFPHHENEVAQSEACTGDRPFVRYWLHSGVVNVGGEKMSKSLGNFITIREALQLTSPNVLRMMFLTSHYRSPLDYDSSKLESAKSALSRFASALRTIDRLTAGQPDIAEPDGPLAAAVAETGQRFTAAMEDDFNTAQGLAALFDVVSTVNVQAREQTAPDAATRAALVAAKNLITTSLDHLGFQPLDVGGEEDGLADALMELVLKLRKDARAARNWALSDSIRDSLAELGIVLEDHPDGTTWHRSAS